MKKIKLMLDESYHGKEYGFNKHYLVNVEEPYWWDPFPIVKISYDTSCHENERWEPAHLYDDEEKIQALFTGGIVNSRGRFELRYGRSSQNTDGMLRWKASEVLQRTTPMIMAEECKYKRAIMIADQERELRKLEEFWTEFFVKKTCRRVLRREQKAIEKLRSK